MKHITTTLFLRIFQFLFLATVLTSCFAPVNLNFESARMLNKGDKDFQVSNSYYGVGNSLYRNAPHLLDELIDKQINCGAKVGFGVTDKYNIKAKVEGLFTYSKIAYNNLNLFIEVDNKVRLSKYASMSLPIGVYFIPYLNELSIRTASIFQFDPRLYLTYAPSNKFELTVIPKCHIINIESFYPGISVGAGFSTDLNKWSIRPEIGYDKLSFSAGISFTKIFKAK